jgi:lactoylglutathione lyase
MAKPAHSMIRVLDERSSIEFYRHAFDLDEIGRLVFDDFTLIFLANPESEFERELTVNHGRTEPYTHGTGYGHFALSVDDLDLQRAKCTQRGLNPTPIKELQTSGQLAIRFFFLTDPDGYEVEVLQRHGRYR